MVQSCCKRREGVRILHLEAMVQQSMYNRNGSTRIRVPRFLSRERYAMSTTMVDIEICWGGMKTEQCAQTELDS